MTQEEYDDKHREQYEAECEAQIQYEIYRQECEEEEHLVNLIEQAKKELKRLENCLKNLKNN